VLSIGNNEPFVNLLNQIDAPRAVAPPSPNTPLPQMLRAARKAAGLSLRDLAKRLGCSHNAVAQWESGVAKPSIANRADLAQALNIPFSHLLPESGRQPLLNEPRVQKMAALLEKMPPEQQEALLVVISTMVLGRNGQPD
jgi:transcriptional regulator with XRE-family HTH domain